MTAKDHFLRLFVLMVLAAAGLVATAILSALVLVMNGMSMSDLMALGQEGMQGLSAGIIRTLLAVQHLFVFILPGLVFGLIYYRSQIWKGLDLAKLPNWVLIVAGILFLLAAYPLVNLSFLANEAIPLPSWAADYEDQAEETLKSILEMNSPVIFILNLLLLAVLPGIGEELLFRGIVQKQIGGILRSPIAAIWIAAFIFSAIHMQFEGFLPRLILGVVLGYLYYWTKNLWVPIIAHAFNNGIQVVLIYAMDMDLSDFEDQGSDQLKWWMILLGVVAMFFLYRIIIKNKPDSE